MSKISLVFILLFITFGCARLELNTKNCDMLIPLLGNSLESTEDFMIEKSIYTPWSPLNAQVISLQEILEEKNIQCSQVRKLEITFKSDLGDAILSCFPFLAHKTLLLKGKKAAP